MSGIRWKRVRKGLAWTAVSCAVLVLAMIAFLEISESRGSWLRKVLYNEDRPTAALTVATIAMRVDRQPEVNLGRMAFLVHRIVRRRPDVDLIVFGESILGWFDYPPDTTSYQRRISEPIPGRATGILGGLARRYRIYICFGLTEASDKNLFNSQVLVGPEGTILTVQRKKNLRSPAFSPGRAPVAWTDIKGVRAALVICYDIQSEETRRLILDHSTDLLILSNADWTEPWDRIGFSAGYLGRRFRSWIVSANRVGAEGATDWDGHIEIIDPLGVVVASGRSREQFLCRRLRFDQNPPGAKKILRGLYGVFSVPYFIGRHLQTAFAYATDGSPGRVWAWAGGLGLLMAAALLILVRHPPWKRKPEARKR
jgi:predicted amidohydrolase